MLEYANTTWSPHHKYDIYTQPIEAVQKRAAKLAVNYCLRNQSITTIKQLDWPTFHVKRDQTYIVGNDVQLYNIIHCLVLIQHISGSHRCTDSFSRLPGLTQTNIFLQLYSYAEQVSTLSCAQI